MQVNKHLKENEKLKKTPYKPLYFDSKLFPRNTRKHQLNFTHVWYQNDHKSKDYPMVQNINM